MKLKYFPFVVGACLLGACQTNDPDAVGSALETEADMEMRSTGVGDSLRYPVAPQPEINRDSDAQSDRDAGAVIPPRIDPVP